MKYYIEITLIDNSYFHIHFIWSKLYTQLHLAFVEMKNEHGKVPVGVSFPEYCYDERQMPSLGHKLRVFGESEAVLEKLDLTRWLSRLTDYVHVMGIKAVPIKRVTGYVQFKRKHVKGIHELSKRYAAKHQVSVNDAFDYYEEHMALEKLPYVHVTSLGNGYPFKLFIMKSTCDQLVDQGFGTYGLSSESTLPEF